VSGDPRPTGAARRRVWIGAALLVLAVALVPVWLGWDRGDPTPAEVASAPQPDLEPTPTTTPSPTALPEEDVTAQPDISSAPLPTSDPATAATLSGTATLEDPAGDVLDESGEPTTEPAEAADLRTVELDGDGEALTVTWTVAGEVPRASEGSLLWSVNLWSGEELTASITVQQVGARRIAGVLDWSTGEQQVLADALDVTGAVVRLRVPLGALPRIDAPVTWTALGQLDGGLEDFAPDEVRADFPG
jgi:hypothetical protein